MHSADTLEHSPLLANCPHRGCAAPAPASLPPCPLLQITEEQRLRAELEHQVESLRQRVAQQRVQMGGVNNSAEQAIKVGAGSRVLCSLAAAQHSQPPARG
jgi:hypothetical protein